MSELDPTKLALDASRLGGALAEINAAWKRFDPEHHTYEAADFGTLETFADVLEQSVYVLGGVRGPFLIGETGSVSTWDASQVEKKIEVDDMPLQELATLLDTTTEPEDEFAFSIIYRAFDAARTQYE